jgi:hypothetical protein
VSAQVVLADPDALVYASLQAPAISILKVSKYGSTLELLLLFDEKTNDPDILR